MKFIRLLFCQFLYRAALFGLCFSLGQLYSLKADQAFTYFHRHGNRYLSVPNHQLSIRQSVDDFDCSMACRRNPNCYSYNIAISRSLNNLKSCELLSTHIFNNSKNLRESGYFDHWTMENLCLQSPCLNGGSCIPIFETGDYKCVCPERYTGGRCEQEGCLAVNAVALGLGNGAVPNNRMTASSYFSAGWEPWRGRLGHRGGSNCWGPKQNRQGEYLQVDLGRVKEIVKVDTQGRYDANLWVTAFELRYSVDRSQWTRYQVNGVVKEFSANWDGNSVKTNLVSPSFKARYVRFYPTKYHSWMDLRAELYGCEA